MQSSAVQQYRLIHDIYVLLDDGDRRLLRTFNLSTSQFAVLLLLDVDQGWRLTDLSERLLFDKSTITRITDRLEEAGLVRRISDSVDRRVQRVVLTPQGQSLRDLAQHTHDRSVERRLSVLDSNEQGQLSALLAKLCSGLKSELDDLPEAEEP